MDDNIYEKIFSVKDKVVVITGGAGFLGAQYAEALYKCGAHIILFDSKSLDEIMDVVDKIVKKRLKLVFRHKIDITKPEEVQWGIKDVVESFGKIDCLINNAAMNPVVGSPEADKQFVPYEEYPVELWREELEVGLTGAQICIQAVAPYMMEQRRGSIINIGSELSRIAYDHRIYGENAKRYKSAAYITVKTAMLGLTRAWAEYLGEYGVRVNTFSPGGVQTDKHSEEFVKRYASANMLRKMGKIGEYAATIIYLCSDASSHMTAEDIACDGGKAYL